MANSKLDLAGAVRCDVVFRHTFPSGNAVEHVRTVFDSATTAGNQAPDVAGDMYGVWLGAHVLTKEFVAVRREQIQAALEGEQSTGSAHEGWAMHLRAAELALFTDDVARGLVADQPQVAAGQAGPALAHRQLRIFISAVEKRAAASPISERTPTLDILANPRLVLGGDSEDAKATQIALGWLDAQAETTFYRQVMGVNSLTVPSIFAVLLNLLCCWRC